jgi:hypothetical protein
MEPCGRVGARSIFHAECRVGGREPPAPTGIARDPTELALGLRVGRAAGLGTHDNCCIAGKQPREPGGEAPRWLCIQRLREHGQLFAHRRGLVVDDVVDGGPLMFQQARFPRRPRTDRPTRPLNARELGHPPTSYGSTALEARPTSRIDQKLPSSEMVGDDELPHGVRHLHARYSPTGAVRLFDLTARMDNGYPSWITVREGPCKKPSE